MNLSSILAAGQNLTIIKGDTMATVSIESIRRANEVFIELKHEKAKAARMEKVITDYETSVHYYQKAMVKCDSIVALQETVITNEEEKYSILTKQLQDAKKEAQRVKVRASMITAGGILLGLIIAFF